MPQHFEEHIVGKIRVKGSQPMAATLVGLGVVRVGSIIDMDTILRWKNAEWAIKLGDFWFPVRQVGVGYEYWEA